MLIDEVRPYIVTSVTRDRWRVARRYAIGLAIVLLLGGAAVVVTTAEWLRAQRNLELVQKTAESLVFDLAQKFRDVSGVSTGTIRQIFTSADDLLKKAGGDKSSLPMIHIRSVMLNEFVDTYLSQGDTGAALAAAEESRALAAQLAASDPDNTGWQRSLSVSWEKLGDVRRDQATSPGRSAPTRNARAIREKLAASGRPEQPGLAARPVHRLGEARRLAAGRGRPRGGAPGLRAGPRHHAEGGGLGAGQCGMAVHLSLIWARVGDVRRDQGDLAGALRALRGWSANP